MKNIKNLLVAVNAKFSHSSLAIRYLRNEIKYNKPILKEYTINNIYSFVLDDILKEEPNIVSFSCYIWNIEYILKLVKDIKALSKDIMIILGGPEVSYDMDEILKDNVDVDIIIYGEGELTYRELINYLYDSNLKIDEKIKDILGIAFRYKNEIVVNNKRELIKNLDDIKFPYDDFNEFENKRIYYESSRGCPYNCSYCLSSTTGKLRYFSLERVKKDLKIFLDNNLMQVKFIDRTFNASRSRTLEIFKFLNENDNNITNFHFEMVAELLDDKIIDYLKNVRPGLFQFEIGVQSTNKKTIEAINRNLLYENLSKKVKDIENVHLHLDLIAGLPFENFDSFINSLDDLLNLGVDKIQLGFLKLLRGSEIRINKDMYDYRFMKNPPYEVFSNKFISYKEILKLKDIEEIIELYYNSKLFKGSIDKISELYYTKNVLLYVDLAKFFRDNNYFGVKFKMNRLYEILYEFICDRFEDDNKEIIFSYIKHDYYLNNKKRVFSIFSDENFNVKKYYFVLRDKLNKKTNIKNYAITKFSKNIFDNNFGDNLVVCYDYNNFNEYNKADFMILEAN